MNDPLLGKTLGQYQILDQIGRGGMARVYRAHHAALDREVAVKVLTGFMASDPVAVARFRRESTVIGRLAHPNILPVYDSGEHDGLLYLVMMYVPGGTLRERAQGVPLDVRTVATLAGQLADALDYAHGQGIVHRDMKPSNVLMSRADWPLIADFGIARLTEERGLTVTGTGLGTPEYMSPEQGQGQHVDSRSDIYSLGVIMYELLTGQTPFQGTNPLSIIHKHVFEPVPSPSRMRADLPAPLEHVVMRALEKDPAARYQTGRELREDLDRAVEQITRSLTSLQSVPTYPDPSRAPTDIHSRPIAQSNLVTSPLTPPVSIPVSGPPPPVTPARPATPLPATPASPARSGFPIWGIIAGVALFGIVGFGCLSILAVALGSPQGVAGLTVVGTPTATPPPTSTPRPSPTPTITPVPPGGTVFEDDFREPARGNWNLGDLDQAYFENGKLHVVSKKPESTFRTWPRAAQLVADLAIEAEITHVSGPTNFSYGIFFRDNSDGSFYLFSITRNGSFAFEKRVSSVLSGDRWETIVEFTRSPAIVVANNAVNTLKVEARDTQFKLFINGQLVREISDVQFRSPGNFGILVGNTDVHVAVSRIKVTRL